MSTGLRFLQSVASPAVRAIALIVGGGPAREFVELHRELVRGPIKLSEASPGKAAR